MGLGRASLNEGQKVVFLILPQGSRRPQVPFEVQLCWALEAVQVVAHHRGMPGGSNSLQRYRGKSLLLTGKTPGPLAAR